MGGDNFCRVVFPGMAAVTDFVSSVFAIALTAFVFALWIVEGMR